MFLGGMNPFANDSSLVIVNLSNGKKTTVLTRQYNRQLFASFKDFSPDGEAFYTLAREKDGFKFVQISLNDGTVTDFRTLFPNVNWNALNWDEFFPPKDDFAYASFTLAPDRSRLVVYKNLFANCGEDPCICSAQHHLWDIDLQQGHIETYRDQAGYVSSASWRADSSAFALSLVGHGGCYPDYLDSNITTFDKDGHSLTVLVNESKSKIDTIGWSPDGSVIAYDVYSTDFVGRLKLVDVSLKQISEVINTQDLGYTVSRTNPITLLFTAWLAPAR